VIARDCPRGFWPEIDEEEWCREHSLKAPEEISPAVETSVSEEEEIPNFLKELRESPDEAVMRREEQAPSKEETPPPMPKKVSPRKSPKKSATKRASRKKGGTSK
jgi:hypothetical protein